MHILFFMEVASPAAAPVWQPLDQVPLQFETMQMAADKAFLSVCLTVHWTHDDPTGICDEQQ